MEQAVRAAQIYERAEIGDVLDGTFNGIAGLNGLKELLLHLGTLSQQQLLAVADISAPVRIVLGNNKLNFLIEILVQISLICIRYKAGRDKYSDFLYDNTEAARKNLSNLCLENFPVVISFFNSLVAAIRSKSLVGKDDLSFTVVGLQNLNFQLVADFKDFCQVDGAVICIFASTQNAIGFAANIQNGFIRLNINDAAFYRFPRMDCLKRFV